MRKSFQIITLIITISLACLSTTLPVYAISEHSEVAAEPEEGSHHGRLLRDGNFAIELAIVEKGVPPEFRVWATDNGQAIDSSEVEVKVKLTRLGHVIDDISFNQASDYLRGDKVVYEPHSFVVLIQATYQGKNYQWQYDNFEGRTKITKEVAKAMEIDTELVKPSTFSETVKVYGKLTLPSDAKSNVYARFDGLVEKVHVRLGDEVKKGQLLLTIESNESLQSYKVFASNKGIVTNVNVTSGEQSKGRLLLQITNDKSLIAELAVFPKDLSKVRLGAKTMLTVSGIEATQESTVSSRVLKASNDQATLFRVAVDNTDSALSEGLFVSAAIELNTFDVAMSVKRSGLQSFRDFTVVYAKVGDEYEVRMLELGRIVGDEVEVLSGISLGTEYVTENSYILKADVEKSGASHDH